jgi:hypothetical protein
MVAMTSLFIADVPRQRPRGGHKGPCKDRERVTVLRRLSGSHSGVIFSDSLYSFDSFMESGAAQRQSGRVSASWVRGVVNGRDRMRVPQAPASCPSTLTAPDLAAAQCS